MEELLIEWRGQRVIIELVSGTLLMGTLYALNENGIIGISDSDDGHLSYVATAHVTRFQKVG